MESDSSSTRRSPTRPRSSGDRARNAANRHAFRAGYRLRMRGRWRWVLACTLVAGPLAALAGWLTAQPIWSASGTVALALGGPSTVDAAATEPAADTALTATPWQRARLDEVLERELDLLKRLGGTPASARRSPDTLTRLEVTARAESADQAQALVAGVLAAYRAQTQLAPEALAADELDAQTQRLDQRRTDLAQRRRDATVGADTPGADVPGDAELRWQAASAAANTAQRRATIATQHAQVLLDAPPPQLTELAAVDPQTRELLDQREKLDKQLSNTVLPPSPRTAERMSTRDTLDAQLKTRLADTRLLPGDADPQPVSVGAALARAERLEAAAAAAADRMDTLEPKVSAQRSRTASFDAEAQALRAEAAALSRQRSALGPGGGVIRLAPVQASGPDLQAVVDHDPRPQRAALWGLAGLGAGGLLPLLWFLSDRRVRRTRQGELAGVETPLLGTVPVMDRAGDAEALTETGAVGGSVASIDAVRAVLEARVEGGEAVFAVTGVAGGSGTTSVAVGLAVSLALAGQRVVLVDLSWLQSTPDTGTGGAAPRDADAGRGVDGVIDELGYLDEEDQERLALSQHAPDADESDDAEDPTALGGFTALLAGAPLAQSVLRTRLPRLSVLSALGRGNALRDAWTGRLSSKWMRRLFEVCRSTGHVLVIDTGAADGGVEGVLACAAADGTLVVVTSRETQTDFVRCAGRLKLVGANVIGTVLNRHGQRRIAPGNPDRRRVASGGTRGSGLFAAAIEARRGDDARRPPLPHGAQTIVPDPRRATDAAPASGHGIDPIDEPPAQVRPTPERRPPAPLTGDRTDAEIHVVDDVMDQLVDHAIRSAQSTRRGPVTPTAASDAPSPPRPDST